MSTLLLKTTAILVTIDDQRREIPGGGLFIRDRFIEQIGDTSQLPKLIADHNLTTHQPLDE